MQYLLYYGVKIHNYCYVHTLTCIRDDRFPVAMGVANWMCMYYNVFTYVYVYPILYTSSPGHTQFFNVARATPLAWKTGCGLGTSLRVRVWPVICCHQGNWRTRNRVDKGPGTYYRLQCHVWSVVIKMVFIITNLFLDRCSRFGIKIVLWVAFLAH